MRALAFIALAAGSLLSGCSVARSTGPASHPSSAPAAVLIVDRSRQQSVAGGRGYGRNGRVPPGIARNLARGKPLPPGIAKQQVPHHVLVELPPLKDGFEYLVVAGKILLVEIATQVIHDILVDVILD